MNYPNVLKWDFRIPLCFIVFLSCITLSAQTWEWANFGDVVRASGGEGTHKMTTDVNGNSYHFGSFSDSLNWQGTNQTTPHAFDRDLYISKFSPTGNLLWMVPITGPNTEQIFALHLDDFGHLYLAGIFVDTLEVGSLLLQAQTRPNNFFLVKMDTSGQEIWARQGGSTTDAFLTGVDTDPSGELRLYGNFRGVFAYDTLQLTSQSVLHVNHFLIRADPQGNVIWGIQDNTVGSGSFFYPQEVAVDRWGSSYVVGRYFGPMTMGGQVLPVYGDLDVYIAKYDSLGVFQWVRGYGGPHTTFFGINVGEYVYGVDVDDQGNTYMAGSFLKDAQFGTYQLFSPNFQYGSNGYIAKHDTAGNLLWVAQGQSSTSDLFTSVRVAEGGGAYFCGKYNGQGVFGTDTLNPQVGFGEAMVGKVTAAGQFDWASSASDSIDIRAYGVDSDTLGGVYVTGSFDHKATFGNIQLQPSNRLRFPFMAKLRDQCGSGPSPQIIPGGPTSFCTGDSVQLTVSGGGFPVWSTGDTTSSIWVFNTDSLQVMVQDSLGCTGTSSVLTVLENPLPQPMITPPGPLEVCKNDTVTLYSSPGSMYLWSNGAITDSIRVFNSGAYTVTLTDSNGCQGTSSPVQVTQIPGPLAQIIPQGPILFCDGDSVELVASGGGTYLWNTGQTTPSIQVFATDTFSIIATDSAGCRDTSIILPVQVFPLPSPVVAQNGSIVTTGSFSTYQWYRNDSLISGATQQDYHAGVSGCFSVSVTDSNGCMGLSDTLCLMLNGRGYPGFNSHWRVYPNPSAGSFWLEIPNADRGHWQLIDLTGKVIRQESYASSKEPISISGIPNGIYLLRVYAASGEYGSFRIFCAK